MAASSDGDGPPAAKRPRVHLPRGAAQQMSFVRQQARAEIPDRSQLADFLIQQWCWGDISTPMLQKIAMFAVADGAKHPDLEVMAKLGTEGRHPNNMYKQLVTKLMPSAISSALTTIKIWNKRVGKTPIQVDQPILLPHTLFSTLYHQHRDVFVKQMMGGDTNEVGKFWAAMQGNPYYEQHLVKHRRGHKGHCIPIALHGDGVSTSGCGKWAKGVDAYSWGSLLSKSSNVITSMFLIFVIFTKFMLNHTDMDGFKAFERKLAWSLYWLFLGKWPKRDEFNREYVAGSKEYKLAHETGGWLAGGYFGVLWVLRGDLDHMSKAWGLVSTSRTTAPCSCCRADDQDDGRPWTDARLDRAAWVGTIWDNASWSAAHPDRSHIFKVLPGLGIMSFIPDVMHCLHLGCYQRIFGSTIKLLTHYILPGSAESNCDLVWQEIKQFYKDPLPRMYQTDFIAIKFCRQIDFMSCQCLLETNRL